MAFGGRKFPPPPPPRNRLESKGEREERESSNRPHKRPRKFDDYDDEDSDRGERGGHEERKSMFESRGPEGWYPPPPPPASKLVDEDKTQEIPIPEHIALHLMTEENREFIVSESNADVQFDGLRCVAVVKAAKYDQEAMQIATKLINRVIGHCKWGANKDKISRILNPRKLESVSVRLSPMSERLPTFERVLKIAGPQITIGKEKECNDCCVRDALVSRRHCTLELDIERGAIYAIDLSTNGTFLNGTKLPAKGGGKVLLSHGDELVLKTPDQDPSREFGWIVSISEMVIKEKEKIQAPRRITSWGGEMGANHFGGNNLV